VGKYFLNKITVDKPVLAKPYVCYIRSCFAKIAKETQRSLYCVFSSGLFIKTGILVRKFSVRIESEHVECQILEGLEDQLACIAKGVTVIQVCVYKNVWYPTPTN
jgi:hypothetical protein